MNTDFDPHPANELGRGTLDPATEAWLLARGAVFARTVPGVSGKPVVEFSCRPFVAAVTAAAVDARQRLAGVTFPTTNATPIVIPA